MSQTGMARGNSVMLVHGGSTDGSGWEGVYELLVLGVFIWLLQAWMTREDARPGKDAHTLEQSRRGRREL